MSTVVEGLVTGGDPVGETVVSGGGRGLATRGGACGRVNLGGGGGRAAFGEGALREPSAFHASLEGGGLEGGERVSSSQSEESLSSI